MNGTDVSLQVQDVTEAACTLLKIVQELTERGIQVKRAVIADTFRGSQAKASQKYAL